jgi:hypothetical protein
MWGQPPSAVRRAKLDGFLVAGVELSRLSARTYKQEDSMRAYLAKLTPNVRLLLAVPVIAIAYMVVTCVLPAVVHAAVPEVVRSVLRLI